MNCPICQSGAVSKYHEDKFRQYFLCSNCTLVFIPRESILAFADEAQRYEAHQNDDDEPDYISYLGKIVDSVRPELSKGSRGLDFGCGKTTLLEKLFEAHGIEMDSYDLYFHPTETVWKKNYNFIILSEVIEHLSDPTGVMRRLKKNLRFRGKFFIKTKLYPSHPEAFAQWYYKRDMTHVQFFSGESLYQLAGLLKMKGPKKLSEDVFEFY
ncbi:MAG TPA: class I SAM-dependent methyltransferase [Bacteriovoracaceae bacterium]|nr:class I SAM-dependent methyltransferase [Bacteriovoracaceae bacterium]